MKYTEDQLNELGDKLAENLGMQREDELDSQKRIRWILPIGTKTGLGFLRTLESILANINAGRATDEIAPAPDKLPTIYEIKRLNIANGGKFFSRETMALAGDTLKNFRVFALSNGQLFIERIKPVRVPGEGRWQINPETGRIVV